MRTAPWLAFAGALLLVASCSSSSDVAKGEGINALPGVTTTAPVSSDPSATTAPADSSATTAPVPESTPPTSLPTDPAAAIQAFYATGGGKLSDTEAACIVASTGPGIVDSLNAALSGGEVAPDAGKSLLKAFAACEPSEYVTQTIASLVQQSGASQDQATCVLHAVDQLFVADDAVLTQASSSGSTAEWPAAEHDKFSNAVKTCVPDDLAAKIVDA
jgi:hypothetical protein